MAKNTVQQFRFCFCTNISEETNHFPVAIGTAVGAHTHTHPHAQKHASTNIFFFPHVVIISTLSGVKECSRGMFKTRSSFSFSATFIFFIFFFTLAVLPAHGDRLVPGCCGSMAVWSWPRCWRGRRTRRPEKLLFKPRTVACQRPVDISQVVSGVCGGRVRGEAAGLIGRRDPGRRLLFAVRGVLPSWVGMLPGRVMTSGSGTSALRIYRFDLILPVFIAFKKKKRR